jgi:hypothetical protein
VCILMLSGGSGSTCAKLASQSEGTAAISLHTSKHDEGVIISNHFASLWESSDQAERYKAQLLDFMAAHVYPAEPVYHVRIANRGTLIITRRSSRISGGGAAPGFVEFISSVPAMGSRVDQSGVRPAR